MTSKYIAEYLGRGLNKMEQATAVCVCVCTLLGAAVVCTGPRVGCVLRVPRGGAVAGPVELVRLVLREQTQGLVLEATLELPWTHTHRPSSNAVEVLIGQCVLGVDLLKWGLTGAVKGQQKERR